MKKFLHCFVTLLLVVSLLCALNVSSMALSDNLKHVYDGGYLDYANGNYRYSIDTAASTTFASASISFGKTARLSAYIEASLTVNNKHQYNTKGELCSGTAAYASVTNSYVNENGVLSTGKINSAIGEYNIGTTANFKYTVD